MLLYDVLFLELEVYSHVWIHRSGRKIRSVKTLFSLFFKFWSRNGKWKNPFSFLFYLFTTPFYTINFSLSRCNN